MSKARAEPERHRRCTVFSGEMPTLTEELARLAELVMFTREHGIPVDTLARLAEIAEGLATSEAETAEKTQRLRRAAADLAAAVVAMMRGDPAAPEHFHRRAKGLGGFLARAKLRSGS